MADLGRIKRNVSKMVSLNAPESDIDTYISGEGVTVDEIRNFKGDTSMVGLPNIGVVEKEISQREPKPLTPTSVFQSAKLAAKEAIKPSIPGLPPGIGVLKEQLRGLEPVTERIISGVTSSGLEAQKGSQLPDIVGGAVRGVTGEQVTRSEDIFRAVGMPELPSKFAGGASDMAILASLGGLLSKAYSKVRPMTPNWQEQRAKFGESAINNVRKSLGKKYDIAYGKVNADPIPEAEINTDLMKLPKQLFNEVVRGKARNTVGDVKKIKDAIVKQINDTSWVKAQQSKGISINQNNIMKTANKLKQTMLKYMRDPEAKKAILDLDPKWEEIVKKGDAIKSMLKDYKTGVYGIKKTSKLLETGGSESKLLTDLKKYSKDISRFIGDINRFNVRQGVKRGVTTTARRLLPYATAGAVGYGASLIGGGD